MPSMSQLKKQTFPQPHHGALYIVDGKHKTASSPSSGSENSQAGWFGINEKALLQRLDLILLPNAKEYATVMNSNENTWHS